MGKTRCITGFIAALCLAALPALAAEVAPSSPAMTPITPVVTQPASAPENSSGSAPVVAADYKVAADDVLQLTVWGEPQMQTLLLQVTPEGVVSAPVVGTIAAAGRTVSDIKNDIANKFVQMDYLRNPIVQLTLYSIHKMRVRVLGQVLRPGLQQMRDGDKVDQAVADAGSFIPDTAGLAKATITRIGEPNPIPVDLEAFFHAGDSSQNIVLKDGDTLYIPEDTENRYYVMGHVAQPGSRTWKRTVRVSEALANAGGPNPRGAVSRTVIIRKAHDGHEAERIPVNMVKFNAGDASQDVLLQKGDIVFVPETKKPDFGTIGQILGAAFNFSYLWRVGL